MIQAFPSTASGDLIADRRFAWGEAAAKNGDHAAAADIFAQTLELVPQWAPAWLALGASLERLGDTARAADAYTRAAALDGDNILGARLRLAALGAAAAPDIAPPAYVRGLFDQYAPRYDAHLVGALAYRGPEIIYAAVERARAAQRLPMQFARMLDLGCGTGLAARAFAGSAALIEGVDLSPSMIDLARNTGLYAGLHAGDLVAFLRAQTAASADLIVAADVFIYMGDLAPAFAASARALAPGGLLAFTTQRIETGDWALGHDLRYAHSAAHIEALARSAGLAVTLIDPAVTRAEAGRDAPGLVVVLAPSAFSSEVDTGSREENALF